MAEVEFAEWTRTRTLRAPVFKGLRDDKDPREVVAEEPRARAVGERAAAVESARARAD